ncbi:tRNA threonylcarbamoyladenosine biosynthesis protein TsaE [Variibacter gotjawalensis]|uniref:tRNA threonylcarbamoyladenosine biosynthesis protein TsaE n=1 Tax=Variibacter gotjawalensis TaxID=1333996 RepID=A0A0S3Q0P0_9BRAD|nr:tRNA (adenosine(37)-N6)-threonylcarbamoyltransferase complex ATPase subunit type 1 TsaE [Variibacter gotjawalensis]NIK47570.1 hypothetical protein [Variibacter gotjawalensis]RZS49467.1 hypothetical protein EV661_1901 [Variibacter gotjawalensis]BAT61730.1 tRNA threonylcarbamoyladenosine biosynthesis protein TsaE [Variibacter gotjawalensis]
MLTMMQNAGTEIVLADEDATRRLAADLSPAIGPGDLVALSGDLGAGKTAFARALIRHLAGEESIEVPSPTFTLVQTYDLPQFPLVHLDLYRLGHEDELLELGIDELFAGAVTLVEWPDRGGSQLPTPRMSIHFAMAPELGPQYRRVTLDIAPPVPENIAKLLTFQRFLSEAGFGSAERVRLQGDASTRIYDRLVDGERSAILMIAPRRPDGPIVRDGKPYSQIAHLAEDVTPFVAMARGLRERGLAAPEIMAADLDAGLLVLEDFGNEPVVSGNPPSPIDERYATAIDALVSLHAHDLPGTLPVAPGVQHRIPRYDIDAMMIEVELLLDWYLPQQSKQATDEQREEYVALWREALEPAMNAPATWVLRDFHSPNLMWREERQGLDRLGILDFQDALLGPAAYDVVSLLQDARVDVPLSLEDTLISRYMKGRRASDREFDLVQFVELYALMGAQRATKIVGIFARLDKRDGKPQYLRHQPRVWRNMRRSLAHPSLAKLKAWYDENVPPLKA